MIKTRKTSAYLAALVAVLWPGLAGWAGQGYLKTVGPAPLRFLPPAKPIQHISLADLMPPEPEQEPEQEPAISAAIKSPPVPVATNADVVTVVQSPAAEPQPGSNIGTAPAEENISPQMLLKYFNKSTNGASTSVIAPLNFAPPRRLEIPSSTAVYTNGP